MLISGTPSAVGQSQRAVVGKNVKLTTENAETAAMYEPSIPPMWANHHARGSAGGGANLARSTPASTIPSAPKTTGTIPSRSQLGPGRTSPSTASAALVTNVPAAAAQSAAVARSPCAG